MKNSTVYKPAVILPLTYGVEIDLNTLASIVGALQPNWDKLPQKQKDEVKLLVANMMTGNSEAAQRFHDFLLIWFPFPIPPFPPIIWDKATVGTFSPLVGVGLILIGIGLMLLA